MPRLNTPEAFSHHHMTPMTAIVTRTQAAPSRLSELRRRHRKPGPHPLPLVCRPWPAGPLPRQSAPAPTPHSSVFASEIHCFYSNCMHLHEFRGQCCSLDLLTLATKIAAGPNLTPLLSRSCLRSRWPAPDPLRRSMCSASGAARPTARPRLHLAATAHCSA